MSAGTRSYVFRGCVALLSAFLASMFITSVFPGLGAVICQSSHAFREGACVGICARVSAS